MKKLMVIVALFFLLNKFNCFAAEIMNSAIGDPGIGNSAGYVLNRIVVKFDSATLKAVNDKMFQQARTGIPDIDTISQRHKAVAIRRQFPGPKTKKFYRGNIIDLSGWHKIEFAENIDPVAVIEEYKSAPGVIDAQPISIHPIDKTPIEQFYDRQWHLPKMQAPAAWDIQTGNQAIIVAAPDTGVRYFAQDLGGSNASYETPANVDGNMWINWAEKNGTQGIDDDGNGYVDDWIGWDFVAQATTSCDSFEDCAIQDNDPRDAHGHGTHCAGNLGAINNNGEAGSSLTGGWGNGTLEPQGNGVKVMALRIGWSASQGLAGYVEMDYAAEALYYAANKGARIASCSWGSENTGGLGDAIDYFLAHGGLIFKAAGNENKDVSATGDYMCSRDDVVCVAASDQNDCKASFSNYGSWVDMLAPGTNIWSLVHLWYDPAEDYFAAMDGTSMATPLAASVAALIWSVNPSLTANQVKVQLYGSADNIYALSCNAKYNGKLGAGRINAFRAVQIDGDGDGVADYQDNCPHNPNGPNLGSCSATSDNPGIVCSSDADCVIGCSSNGLCIADQRDSDGDGIGDVCDGTPLTTTISPATSTTSVFPTTTTTSALPITTTTVLTTTTITPPMPSAPTNLSATAVSTNQINLAWTDNSTNETGFRIERAASSSGPFSEIATVGANVTAYSNTGLKRNTTYYYRVRAYNVSGNSGYSNTAAAKTFKQ